MNKKNILIRHVDGKSEYKINPDNDDHVATDFEKWRSFDFTANV